MPGGSHAFCYGMMTDMDCARSCFGGWEFGRAKIALADAVRSDVDLNLMASSQHAVDPDSLLNPGVITRMIDK